VALIDLIHVTIRDTLGLASRCLLARNTGDDLINPQQHTCTFNGRLDGLLLNHKTVHDALLLDIADFALLAVDAEKCTFASLRVLGAQVRQDAHNVDTAIWAKVLGMTSIALATAV